MALAPSEEILNGRYTDLYEKSQQNSELLMWQLMHQNDFPYAPVNYDSFKNKEDPRWSEKMSKEGYVYHGIETTEGRPTFDEDGKMTRFGLPASDTRSAAPAFALPR